MLACGCILTRRHNSSSPSHAPGKSNPGLSGDLSGDGSELELQGSRS
jgi:hypothetical protein